MGKPKKLVTKKEVKAHLAVLNRLCKSTRDANHRNLKINFNQDSLLTILERSRRIILQLDRPMRDYSK